MAESLRERKKARTRAELIRVSQRLFHEQGFAATTLDQICEEVQVVPQTLLRYFDSKHKLALAPQYDACQLFADGINDPARSTDVLSTWRAFSLARADHAVDDPRPFQLCHRTPELRNAQFDIVLFCEDVLRDWFNREAGTKGDLDAQLLACALVAGEHAAYRRWLDGGTSSDLTADVARVIDRAAAAFPRPSAPRPGTTD